MGLLRECIIVGGQDSGGNVLAKARDRNYKPKLLVIRELTPEGVELAYIFDAVTNYLEGMNSFGIGIVNAALLVTDDESAAKKYWKRHKKRGISRDGPRIARALGFKKLSKVIKSLVAYDSGLKGHTFVGNPTSIYSIEMTSKHNPIVKKLDKSPGYDVRTNHGEDHAGAGYTPTKHPGDYTSSKIRRASASVAISDIDDYRELMPSLANQNFDKDSNFNTMRKVPGEKGMRTSSQIAMHLDRLEMICYMIPGECQFLGIEDRTPEGYIPKINVTVKEYKSES